MSAASHKQARYALVCRFAQAVDQRRKQALARLFSPDAVPEGPGFSFNGKTVRITGQSLAIEGGNELCRNPRLDDPVVTLHGAVALQDALAGQASMRSPE
ncbi:hypothetical protein PSH28_10315 [Pseudomonas resinovorans]|uniref:hypothetical protein n=1 Tax=Metapseudomonas resinovorans TaxID=53412 RepID=UPI00237FAC86|nr:hypothetical protein [Pseudomonas resinovorans]MDE3736988.1 hypothetical protein [Pseudomonas resinovorans]